ncbi:CHAT domain-containing protein, partial [Albimonas pacifica]
LSGDREALALALEGWRAALEVRTTEAAPDLHLQTARSLARRLFDEGAYPEVVSVLDVALGATRAILSDPKKARDAREQAAERASGLAGLRAWAGLETGEPAAAALEALELGRARLLALALAGTGEDAPAPRTASQLRAAIPSGAAAVVPFATPAGAKAFVLRGGLPAGGAAAVDEADLLDLPGLDEAGLRELLYGPADERAITGYLGAYNRLQEGIAEKDPGAFSPFAAAAQAALARLGDLLLAPADARLRALGLAPGAPVVLLLPGLLSVLPLAAAPVPAAPDLGRPAESFGDRWTVSLAPCFEALIAARDRAAAWAAEGARTRLLAALDPAVIRPDPETGRPERHAPLALAAAEDALLRRRARPGEAPVVLRGAEATAAALLAALPRADLFHYSGHGSYKPGRPRDSQLVTAGDDPDDVLTVARLVEAHERGALRLRLAILSGCETNLVGLSRTQDEFVGLPAAFLEAGAAAVLASHWPVLDHAAFLFARRFHEVLDLAPGPGGEPAFGPAPAAREAARWLRELTVGELLDLFETVPQPAGAEAPAGCAWLELSRPRGAAHIRPTGVQAEPLHHGAFLKKGPEMKARDPVPSRPASPRRDPVLGTSGTRLVLQPPAHGAPLDLDAKPYANPVHW